MPTPCLKEFAQALPVCSQTSGLAAVLEIFCTSGCDAIVVVNEQQRPLTLIKLSQVLPYLLPSSLGTPLAKAGQAFHKPLSQLEPAIFTPLSILPAHLNVSEFWEYLHSCQPPTKDRLKQEEPYQILTSSRWALVDETEKFLGLLDSSQLLNSLAQKFSVTERKVQPEKSLLTQLNPLVHLLEQLPLPLSLQTASGEILAQNQTWQTQVGTAADASKIWSATASRLDSLVESASKHNPSSLSTNAETTQTTHLSFGLGNAPQPNLATVPHHKGLSEQAYEISDSVANSIDSNGIYATQMEAPDTKSSLSQIRQKPSGTTNQHYCALDTPHMAAAVSGRQVMLSALSLIKTQDEEVVPKLPTPQTQLNHAHQSFSFVKIPLPPAFIPTQGIWGTQAFASAASELLLVVAQDTTEQQQVAKELAAKNADLVQLNRLKDEFLACISHELKTPLTAVLGLSSLLKDQTLGALNERQTRYARLIYHSGRQLMTVVNDILDLTRMETGQLELTLEPVQIQSVCDRAYAQAQQRPSEKNQQDEETLAEIKFTLEIEPGLELLVADELRLRQMLMHLLSNALKFTDTSGEIGLKVNNWEGWIAFTVWDTGIGIPAEKQHLIFQKFQQLEKPLTRRYEGTGLGLVLTQRLARLHGGEISFISKVGTGSQFTLLLPPIPPLGSHAALSQSPLPFPESKSSNFPPSPASKPNRLVLLVETVPQYLENLTKQLNNLAYRVVIARSGTEAIEKARSLQPCAVLLNPLLPQLSGWDVLTLLKSDAQTRHIPAIVTATQAEKQQAFQNKADGFLSLPVEEQALLKSLTSLGNCPLTPTKGSLTILHLSPELNEAGDSSVLSSELTAVLNHQNPDLNYRVLEADDLDQAALLVRVWHPDVVLLDSARLADPFSYLEEFLSYPDLLALPLVTLDRQTTAAANLIKELTVYPCLAADETCKIAALMQVLQVASGMSRQPSILLMDIGQDHCFNHRSCYQTAENSEYSLSSNSLEVIGATSVTCWSKALIQYLETAGFRSIISCAWTDVHRQFQDQSVDLLVLRLQDTSNAEVLRHGLSSLVDLPTRPPVFVLDHRSEDEVMNCKSQLTSELESLMLSVATKILPSSHSMSQLLHSINQALMDN